MLEVPPDLQRSNLTCRPHWQRGEATPLKPGPFLTVQVMLTLSLGRSMGMPALTRRRYPERQDCWLVHHGDVHVGTIAIRHPHDTDA